MLANNFTKALSKPKFENYYIKIGMTLTKENIILKAQS